MATPIAMNFFTDLCPCGSGRLIKDCCLTERYVTVPPEPKTGYFNPKCFARELLDCNETITHEHFLSEGVLRTIEEGDKPTRIHGALGGNNKNVGKQVPINAIASQILCERHNKALSPLDKLAGKFTDFLFTLRPESDFFLLNGSELERWMLKVFIGFIASGIIQNKFKGTTPQLELLQIIFGNNRVPDNTGLFFIQGEVTADRHQVGIYVFPLEEGNVTSNYLVFIISGFVFLFIYDIRALPKIEPRSGIELVHHPKFIQVINGAVTKEIHFGWPEGKGVFVNISKSK
jgi:hypothetical protein